MHSNLKGFFFFLFFVFLFCFLDEVIKPAVIPLVLINLIQKCYQDVQLELLQNNIKFLPDEPNVLKCQKMKPAGFALHWLCDPQSRSRSHREWHKTVEVNDAYKHGRYGKKNVESLRVIPNVKVVVMQDERMNKTDYIEIDMLLIWIKNRSRFIPGVTLYHSHKTHNTQQCFWTQFCSDISSDHIVKQRSTIYHLSTEPLGASLGVKISCSHVMSDTLPIGHGAHWNFPLLFTVETHMHYFNSNNNNNNNNNNNTHTHTHTHTHTQSTINTLQYMHTHSSVNYDILLHKQSLKDKT